MASEKSVLFDSIPSNWEQVTLGEVCKRGGGYVQTGPFGSQLHASDYVPVGVPTIMPTDISENQIRTDRIARITEKDAERLNRHRLEPGNIVFSRRGDVTRRALIRDEQKGWLCGTGSLKIDLGTGVVDPLFASLYFGHPDVKDWIVRHAVGSTMPNLNTEIMEAVPFLLPPSDEQHAITRKLGVLDEKIELNRRMNQILESMAQALFKSWFIDFDPVVAKSEGRQPYGMNAETAALFPSDFQDAELGSVPKGWMVGNLKQIVEVNPNTLKYDYPHKEIYYIDISSVEVGNLTGVTKMEIKNAPSRAKRLVKHGDTIWSCVRPNRKSYLFVQHPLPNVVVSTGFAVLSPKVPSNCFVYLWVTTDDFIDYLTANAEGSAYPAVKPESFERASVLIPSDDVLAAFEKLVKPLFELRYQNASQSQNLASIRDTLLPKLLSGELRVKVT